jgi:hypothetical protein
MRGKSNFKLAILIDWVTLVDCQFWTVCACTFICICRLFFIQEKRREREQEGSGGVVVCPVSISNSTAQMTSADTLDSCLFFYLDPDGGWLARS